MNIMDRWAVNDRLRGLIAERMLENGEVLSHHSRSNEYVGMDRYMVRRFGRVWSILYIDGMACEIEAQD